MHQYTSAYSYIDFMLVRVKYICIYTLIYAIAVHSVYVKEQLPVLTSDPANMPDAQS